MGKSLLKGMAVIFVVIATASILFVLIALIARERTRVESGTCATFECLSKAIREPEVLSQLPRDARDAEYWFMPHGRLYEITFPMEEAAFIDWVTNLGWTRAEIAEHKREDVPLLRYSASDDDGTPALTEVKGYGLTGATSYHGTQCRVITYDLTSSRAFIQLWLPLSDNLVNE